MRRRVVKVSDKMQTGYEYELVAPVAAPWLKLSEIIDYILEIKPKHSFPVHDGSGGFSKTIWQRTRDLVLTPAGFTFDPFDPGETKEF